MARKPLLLLGMTVTWLTAVAAGLFWLSAYQAAPGRSAPASVDWPADSALRPEAGRFILVLFAHPRCPCTRASFDELSWVLARSQGRVDAYAVFVLPEGAPDGWERTGLWAAAAAIPGVRVSSDVCGTEATLFGARTSGQALLYDPHGRLVFRGGLTAGRGHMGDSPGRSAVVACVAGVTPERRDAPVFGCSLLDSD